MTHRNAPLTPEGRRRMVEVVVIDGWSYRRVAERFQISPATVSKWVRRFRAGESLDDRSSRPTHSPTRTAPHREQQILDLRAQQQWGPHRIAWQLGMPPSTVHRVLRRHQMPRLCQLDRARGTGAGARTGALRDDGAGELVHIDIKKLGRIPDGAGTGWWGVLPANATRRARALVAMPISITPSIAIRGWCTPKSSTMSAGDRRRILDTSQCVFASIGITVTAIMTDNGSCYRSRVFANALGSQVRHRFTRPYRPQTNGKVERFNRTLVQEWAYATAYTSDEARSSTYQDWIHWYNHHRHHTGIGGLTPAQRVHNLTGYYS